MYVNKVLLYVILLPSVTCMAGVKEPVNEPNDVDIVVEIGAKMTQVLLVLPSSKLWTSGVLSPVSNE